MMLSGEKRTEALRLLKDAYPDARPALHFSTPFELLVATMLSAQCTDKQVNKVTDVMFQIYRTAKDFAAIDLETLEPYIHSCGFFRAKGQNILAMSRILCEKYGGEVPRTMEELTALPGVGRKTANLILGDVFRVPGSVVVDTHCIRLSNRLGLVDDLKDPPKIEAALRKILPPESSSDFCHCIVLHGRAVCDARKPRCEACCVRHLCRHFSG